MKEGEREEEAGPRDDRGSRQQPLSCGHWKEKRSMRMPGKSVKKVIYDGVDN